VSTPYSPYGSPGGGPYDSPNPGQYGGAPNQGQYGAPNAGPYGAPNAGQYGAPNGGPYGAPNAGQYGAPNGGQYGMPGGYPPPGYPQQRGYLQGGPVDFQSAIKLQFENITNFEGRASLSAYWFYVLGLVVVDVVLVIFASVIGSVALFMLLYLVMLAVGLSSLSLGIRRLHDVDKSGWFMLLGFIPFGGLVLLYFMVQQGTPNQNRFG
jgi:uncharacterized membrane protein YhaH (DUF805 family)